jgi:hypothetical protein
MFYPILGVTFSWAKAFKENDMNVKKKREDSLETTGTICLHFLFTSKSDSS